MDWTDRRLGLDLPRAPATDSPIREAACLLDIAVRIDLVTVWTSSRTLAVVDRDQLRAWIGHPFEPMARDDLQFTLVDRLLCLLIDGTGPYALNAGAVARLVQVL